jgi:hypothetical protein
MIKPTVMACRFLKINLKLASAGSASKTYREAQIRMESPNFIVEGKPVNVKDYKLFVVDGNSMNRFHLNDGQVLFIEKCHFSALSENESSVLVLTVGENDKIKKYKLRKCRGFYDCRNDFNVWFQNSNLDAEMLGKKLDLDKGWTNIEEKIEECKQNGCRLLVSETTVSGSPVYSFHPESRIYGRVRYAVPRNKVEIIKKL